ncbi:MAG: hypothetical protein AAFR96_08240 [Planctomycetota bacterium]
METKRHNRFVGRLQGALLPALLVLVAADVFVRLAPPAAQAEEIAAQPETDGVPTLVNPARQRSMILDELKALNSRISGVERALDGRIRVEVTNFPKVQASSED